MRQVRRPEVRLSDYESGPKRGVSFPARYALKKSSKWTGERANGAARLQDQVGQSEIIPPANCNERIFEGVD